jgi:hypothetical protein
MNIRYEYDQYDLFCKYVDDVPVGTFKIQANDPLYIEWSGIRDTVETLFVPKIQEMPTLQQVKDKSLEDLKDIINDFMSQFTKRFSDAEVTNFGEQVLQAQDYLAHGPNDYNSPITIEANITGYPPEQIVQLILGHHAFQKRLMPWVRGFRQNTSRMILESTTTDAVYLVMEHVKPALYGALQRNEI